MIIVAVQNLEDLESWLGKLTDPNLVRGILDEAEALQLNRIRTRFLAEKDTNDTPWVPSKAGLRRRALGGTGTLFDTGKLFHSIQAFASGPFSRSIGTDVPYAWRHQYGVGTVKREFLGFSEADVMVIEKMVVRRFEEALK